MGGCGPSGNGMGGEYLTDIERAAVQARIDARCPRPSAEAVEQRANVPPVPTYQLPARRGLLARLRRLMGR